jgi:hypothetical protein
MRENKSLLNKRVSVRSMGTLSIPKIQSDMGRLRFDLPYSSPALIC